MIPTGAPYSRGRSLWTVVCAFLTPSLPSVIILHSAKQAQVPLCVQLNYSIRKTFVNGFEQNLRHPDAVCTGYLAVLDGHGRVSCIPPISIFFIAHCITNRPIVAFTITGSASKSAAPSDSSISSAITSCLATSNFIISGKIIPCQSPVVVILFALSQYHLLLIPPLMVSIVVFSLNAFHC